VPKERRDGRGGVCVAGAEERWSWVTVVAEAVREYGARIVLGGLGASSLFMTGLSLVRVDSDEGTLEPGSVSRISVGKLFNRLTPTTCTFHWLTAHPHIAGCHARPWRRRCALPADFAKLLPYLGDLPFVQPCCLLQEKWQSDLEFVRSMARLDGI
jgi:hypothetical protein